MVLLVVKSCVRDSHGPDFAFYLDNFLFLTSLRTFTKYKMLIWSTFVSSGPLAQLVERGANNGKVLCSKVIRNIFPFLSEFGLLSLFKQFSYIHCLKMLICSMFVSNGPLAQLQERGAPVLITVRSFVRGSCGPDFTFYLDDFLLFK